jgi:hypothetical protein
MLYRVQELYNRAVLTAGTNTIINNPAEKLYRPQKRPLRGRSRERPRKGRNQNVSEENGKCPDAGPPCRCVISREWKSNNGSQIMETIKCRLVRADIFAAGVNLQDSCR